MEVISTSRTLAIGEKEYVLDGSFATLRKVQERFGKDIVQALIALMDMPLDAVADLIAIASGKPDEADAIGQAICDHVGLLTIAYVGLKTQLVAWLTVAVSPVADREKKRAEMQAIIDKQSPSPGASIASSV